MSILFLLLFLFNSTISADLLNEAIEQDLQVNQNQSLNKELAQPVAPPEKPDWKKRIVQIFIVGVPITFVLSRINIPVEDEEKKINNQPVIPPAQSEDIFIKTLESNVEKQLNTPEKNFYKTIGIHYLFGDLLGLLYIYDNYKWIENKGETQWQYNDESNKLTKKINFILELNRILDNVFTQIPKNICWYWNKDTFQSFLKNKLQNQESEYKKDEDPTTSILTAFNENFDKDSKNKVQWASYGLSKNNPLVTIDDIWQNQENKFVDNTVEFSTNTYEDGNKKNSIEFLYYGGVTKPSEKFLTDLNDYYWPFVEKVFNNLDTMSLSINFEQQLKSLTSFENMDDSEENNNNNIKNFKQIFLSFILEKIKEVKHNLEGSVQQNLDDGVQTSLTIQMPNLTWNLSKDETKPVFVYLLMVYLQFITEKIDKGFQWEEKDKKINQTIFQQIAQTFSNAPKK